MNAAARRRAYVDNKIVDDSRCLYAIIDQEEKL
jgi:hypothetical protein